MLLHDISFDIINAFLSLVAVVVLVMIVFRTKKGLDTVFKCYLAAAITLLIASFTRFNSYWDLIPHNYIDAIFQTSRILALLFFICGHVHFLRIMRKKLEQ